VRHGEMKSELRADMGAMKERFRAEMDAMRGPTCAVR